MILKRFFKIWPGGDEWVCRMEVSPLPPQRRKPTKPKSARLEADTLIIREVIELLKQKPNSFSAICSVWPRYPELSENVKGPGNIVVSIKSGQILLPAKPKMTTEEKAIVLGLIGPIVTAGAKELVSRFRR